jgi:hypothetical protein
LLNLASEADIESNFTHCSLLFCDRQSRFLPLGLTGNFLVCRSRKNPSIRYFLLRQTQIGKVLNREYYITIYQKCKVRFFLIRED